MSALRNLLDFRRREFVSFLRARTRPASATSTTPTANTSTALPPALTMPLDDDHFTTTPRSHLHTPTQAPATLIAPPALPVLRPPNTIPAATSTAVLPSLSPFPPLSSFPHPLSPQAQPLLPSISAIPLTSGVPLRNARSPSLPPHPAASSLVRVDRVSRKRPRADTLATPYTPSLPSSPSLSAAAAASVSAPLPIHMQPLRSGRWPAASVASPSTSSTFPPLKFRRLLEPTTTTTPIDAPNTPGSTIAPGLPTENSPIRTIPLATLTTPPTSHSPHLPSPAQPYLPHLPPHSIPLLRPAIIHSHDNSHAHFKIADPEPPPFLSASMPRVVVNISHAAPSSQPPSSFNDLKFVNRDDRCHVNRIINHKNNNNNNNNNNDEDNIDKDNTIQEVTDEITPNTSGTATNTVNYKTGTEAIVASERNANKKNNNNIDDDNNINTTNNNTPGNNNNNNNNNGNNNQAASFECKVCRARFLRKHHMERHVQNVHEGQRPWRCEQCGFSFHQKPNLERHILTVHEEQKPFKCSVCAMSFGRKGVLKKHVQMVHEQTRKFECDICSILFGLKSDLKRHVQSVHQKKRPFVCYVCAASFGRRSDLKRHTLSLHPGAPLPPTRPSPSSSSGQAGHANSAAFPPPPALSSPHVLAHATPTSAAPAANITHAYLGPTPGNHPAPPVPFQQQQQQQQQYYQHPQPMRQYSGAVPQAVPITTTTGTTTTTTNTITTATPSPQTVSPALYLPQHVTLGTMLAAPQQGYMPLESHQANIQRASGEENEEVQPGQAMLSPLITSSQAIIHAKDRAHEPATTSGPPPQ